MRCPAASVWGKAPVSGRWLSHANRRAIAHPDEALRYAIGAIDILLEALATNQWFAQPRSIAVIAVAHIAIGTKYLSQLRIIVDNALAEIVPENAGQLADHVRVAYVLSVQLPDQEWTHLAPIAFAARVMRGEFAFASDDAVAAARMILRAADPRIPCAAELVEGIDAEFDAVAARCRELRSARQRVYPPMIRMIDPILGNPPRKWKEGEREKRELAAERRAVIQQERVARAARLRAQVDERAARRARRKSSRHDGLALMERERTYDLNMAAAPPHVEQEGSASSSESSDESD